ncbi:hypothetical protein HJFPF1_01696 [Paramyrothecium foliicola]|nr:hypothetical protein HJFPF1_01696 [Paramyrothecium foliicola]
MDDSNLDDPGWSWPAWKFGMKRTDLFTSLHDQYNTFTFNIQDPEAFHHDVYEISRDADTSDEFHRLMAARQQQRLRELNESLESLAVEIIANPKLMETEQWQHALQLFRTKSFDSLVRYFASYLPDEYLGRHNDARSTCSSFSEADSVTTVSTKASSVDDAVCCSILEPECISKPPTMMEEPCELDSDDIFHPIIQAPPSPPESEVVVLESSSADVEAVTYRTRQRSRSLSFSPAESEFFGSDMMRPIVLHDDDESSQYSRESTVTSVSDCAESRSSIGPVDDQEHLPIIEIPDDDDDLLTAQHPEDDFDIITDAHDTLESDTPTPRQEAPATCYIDKVWNAEGENTKKKDAEENWKNEVWIQSDRLVTIVERSRQNEGLQAANHVLIERAVPGVILISIVADVGNILLTILFRTTLDPTTRISKSSRPTDSKASQNRAKYLTQDEQSRQFVADEDKFVLKQAKKKADIRVRERRAKPIDYLAFNLKFVDSERDVFDDDDTDIQIDVPGPTDVVQNLNAAELAELESDISSYHVLETNARNLQYWTALQTLCKDRRVKLDPSSHEGRVVNSVSDDIDRILAPKTHDQLEALEKQIKAKLQSNEDIDTDYWGQLLSNLSVWKAKATLKKIYEEIKTSRGDSSKTVSTQHAGVTATDAPSTAGSASSIKDGGNAAKSSRSDGSSAQAQNSSGGAVRFAENNNEDLSQATKALYDREVARGVSENEEIFTAEEAVVTASKPQWMEKYRPRKPRYFNRVQMGYEWNKYNQTHYDHDNPPPKVVQGYKFNIFYPELMDKTKAPTFKIIREHGRKRGESFAAAGEEDTCLIRFIAGPPYEDIAFRIVDREWDYSAKKERGFKSTFDKGILQLHFQFKKVMKLQTPRLHECDLVMLTTGLRFFIENKQCKSPRTTLFTLGLSNASRLYILSSAATPHIFGINKVDLDLCYSTSTDTPQGSMKGALCAGLLDKVRSNKPRCCLFLRLHQWVHLAVKVTKLEATRASSLPDPGDNQLCPLDIAPIDLISAQPLQRTQSLPVLNHRSYGSMPFQPPVIIKSEQSWPTPPLETDDCESCAGQVSSIEDTFCCKLSPSSPTTWPSPSQSFQQPTNWSQLDHEIQTAHHPVYTPMPATDHATCSSSASPAYIENIKEDIDADLLQPIYQSSSPTASLYFAPVGMPSAPMASVDAIPGLPGHPEMLRDEKVTFDPFSSAGPGFHSVPGINYPYGSGLSHIPHVSHTRLDGPYAWLIYKALLSRPSHAMTLQEIYQWFRENTSKANNHSKGWQNSIRHNLSMNAAFTNRDPSGSDIAKRSAEWVLEDWAARDGVQSTTRYRKGTSTRRPYSMRSASHASRRGLRSARSLRIPAWQPAYNPSIALPPTSHSVLTQPRPYAVRQLLMPDIIHPENIRTPDIKREFESMPATPDLSNINDHVSLMLPSSTLPGQNDEVELSPLPCGSHHAMSPQVEREPFPYTMDDVQLPYPTRQQDTNNTDSGHLFAPFDSLGDWEDNP